ncbi:hypothetical protein HAP41_0000048685 (plasmid) [Bradyrhizobium barranii subsp. apii]|uniref:Uncharacterized protein n=1 Tax=Bradyrhizobium barranii subsp. apii TaxID=2819348 RepID=A0A8T5VWZ0_9BRAD|nr:hypothetical protein [Bradyrhizobium barranii]UPT92150.1 hypothetical protein HAP41_0000048685 [Bradyrhizobium barranii subsp. apii]
MARTDWTFALSIAATLGLAVGAIIILFAATGVNATPIAPSVAPTSSVEQVGWVCNPWGRCWWQPNDYRRHRYYRRYRFDGDDWPRRHDYGPRYWGPGYSWGDGHGGWRRGWER